MKKFGLLLCLLLFSFTILAQDQLYKVTLLRAKPGELLSLIDSIKADLSSYEDYLTYKPYLLRHSQGDHWDLMVIHPIEQLNDYFSDANTAKRSASRTLEKTYADAIHNLISFQEEGIVSGPDLETFQAAFEAYRLFHIEIFTAIAGKQEELLLQREAENVFYAALDHRPNFIFTRVFGPSWDNFTIGFYSDMHDFAGPDISFEQEDGAAKAAGFQGVNYIGSYLRALISTHHDTLAWKVTD